MNIMEEKALRLGDCLNFPTKGDIVGVHYDLSDQFGQLIESTRERGTLLEWRVGSASVLEEIDQAIRNVSLGGKSQVKVNGEQGVITYQIELVYIRWFFIYAFIFGILSLLQLFWSFWSTYAFCDNNEFIIIEKQCHHLSTVKVWILSTAIISNLKMLCYNDWKSPKYRNFNHIYTMYLSKWDIGNKSLVELLINYKSQMLSPNEEIYFDYF